MHIHRQPETLNLCLIEGGAGINHGKWNLRELYVEELYKHAIPDLQGLYWYAVDDEGVIHRFGNSNDGKVHWNGDTRQGRGISVSSDVKKRIDKMKKDGKIVSSPCKEQGRKYKKWG